MYKQQYYIRYRLEASRSTIGEGGDTTIPSPGRSPKQSPFRGSDYMIPYKVGKLAPNSTHFTRWLVKYIPGRGYFRAVSSQNKDKLVTPPPAPIVERLSHTWLFIRYKESLASQASSTSTDCYKQTMVLYMPHAPTAAKFLQYRFFVL